MKPTIDIVRATEKYLDAIVRIEQGCFDDDAFTRRQLSYLVRKAQGGCYVALLGGRVAGYISLLARRGCRNLRIYSVAVAAEARGHGVGQALVDKAVAEARRMSLREVTLEVRTDNISALALYTRKGFLPDRLLKNYYHDGTDARRMVLRMN